MSYLMSPTVLVVDDEKRYGERLKRALLDYGSVGAIFVEDLGEAADLILDNEFHFDALLTDFMFTKGDDPARQLFDGLDLVELAQKSRPSLERYVISANIDTRALESKMVGRNIEIKKFFDKHHIAITSRQQQVERAAQPWDVVRADLLRKRLQDDPPLRSRLNVSAGANLTDGNILERLFSTFTTPTITYIQSLGDKFLVKVPIEVVCTASGDGGVRASAPKLGILVDGEGKTPTEAVDNLSDVISAHGESLLGTSDVEVAGYTELVRKELSRHLELVKDAAEE